MDVIGVMGTIVVSVFFFFQAEDGIRDRNVTGVQTCALPISLTEQISQALRLDLLNHAIESVRGSIRNRTDRRRTLIHMRNVGNGGSERAEHGAKRKEISLLQSNPLRNAARKQPTVSAIGKKRVAGKILPQLRTGMPNQIGHGGERY